MTVSQNTTIISYGQCVDPYGHKEDPKNTPAKVRIWNKDRERQDISVTVENTPTRRRRTDPRALLAMLLCRQIRIPHGRWPTWEGLPTVKKRLFHKLEFVWGTYFDDDDGFP